MRSTVKSEKFVHLKNSSIYELTTEPEDHCSCIAYLSTEDMLKSAVIEEKK